MTLPRDESFLDSTTSNDVDGDETVCDQDRRHVLAALRFFFGPARAWRAVRDVSEASSLAHLAVSLHQPGERFDRLEQRTSLPAGFFSSVRHAPAQVRLFVERQSNGELVPSFSAYEQQSNITIYIGPDFLHGMPNETVLNCMPLDDEYRPQASFTLRI